MRNPCSKQDLKIEKKTLASIALKILSNQTVPHHRELEKTPAYLLRLAKIAAIFQDFRRQLLASFFKTNCYEHERLERI